jgi:hypothetical protein
LQRRKELSVTTFDTTVAMMQYLDESDLIKVKEYVSNLFASRELPSYIKKYTREELLEALIVADKQADEGRFKDAHRATVDIRRKYGL